MAPTLARRRFHAHNAQTGRRYHGINVLALWCAAQAYADASWATYRQWASLGAQVRRAERATLVLFYKELPRGDEADPNDSAPFVARTAHVFNAAQIDAAPLPADALTLDAAPELTLARSQPPPFRPLARQTTWPRRSPRPSLRYPHRRKADSPSPSPRRSSPRSKTLSGSIGRRPHPYIRPATRPEDRIPRRARAASTSRPGHPSERD